MADAAHQRVVDITAHIQHAEARRRKALDARAALTRLLLAGEPVCTTALAAATAELRAAEAETARLQDELSAAAEDTKRTSPDILERA